MRVNMDSSILTDPRFKMLAQELGISFREAIGSCFMLWMGCYERRSDCLSERLADASAEVKGFAKALVLVGLADEESADRFVIHGVRERIRFLGNQATRGRSGGLASGKSRRGKGLQVEANASIPEANAKQTLEQKRTTAEAYSPALTPALPLTPTPPPSEEILADASTQPPADKPKRVIVRKPDPLWDAIVAVTGADQTLKPTAAHIGRVKKTLLAANPPYTAEDVLALPAIAARQMTWAAGRALTLGEVEKYIDKVRKGGVQIGGQVGTNGKPTLMQEIIDNGNEFIRLTGGIPDEQH